MAYSRRQILKMSSALALVSTNIFSQKKSFASNKPFTSISFPQNLSTYSLAQDEEFWKKVSKNFHIDSSFINLENGYYGIMPNSVYENYLHNTQRLNQLNSYLLRSTFKNEVELVRDYLAQTLGVLKEEIALTRGGTEALQNLIVNYNKLEPRDQVLYANLDYYSCQYAFDWLQDRKKVELVKINIPEPAEKQAVLDVYSQAFEDYPRLKLILLTHLNNRTGLVLPVHEIVTMAKQRGIDTIVDAAHSWGQLNFNANELNAEFVGFSLHKWLNAPLGVGCLYIKKNRLEDIDPYLGDKAFASTDIRSRVHSGTLNAASLLTIPAALDFHLKLGPQVKEERLRYLRNYWVSKVSSIDAIQILTPNNPEMHAGISSFRIRGRTSQIENENIVKYLFEKHGVFTTQRGGLQKGDCVRVTPALFTSTDDMDKFVKALTDVATLFAI